MFERELMAGSTWDLSPDQVVIEIIKMARWLRSEQTAYQKRQREAYLAYDFNLGRATGLAAADMAQKRVYTIRALQAAINARTRNEEKVAQRAVDRGAAMMAPLTDSGETCGDCDYPVWWHLNIGGRRVCPLGREYWVHLRALTTVGDLHLDLRNTTRMIARETRKGYTTCGGQK